MGGWGGSVALGQGAYAQLAVKDEIRPVSDTSTSE